MYKQRLYIFLSLCVLAISVCVTRLVYLQLICGAEFRERVEKLRILAPVQLPTVRGSIVDRNGNILAVDEAVFRLGINYGFTRLLDDRFWEGSILVRAGEDKSPDVVEEELRQELGDRFTKLIEMIDKCAKISRCSREEIENKIREINDRIWERREFYAWSENCPGSALKTKYKYVPLSKALEDFENQFPGRIERLKMAIRIERSEMYKSQPLIELETDAQLLMAQLELEDIDGVDILPQAQRIYPYGTAACQVIGWVGPGQEHEKELFAGDNYLRYLDNEVLGKDGVERVCEAILRGRRGEVIYDKDNNLLERKETQFGKDVRLSLDIELQKQIEEYLTDPESNSNFESTIGAVVMDAATGDILSLVSLPVYDLNTVRRDYDEISRAKNEPFKNKALYETYPPGSIIKPFILIAGMETGKIGPLKTISCPANQRSLKPKCWVFNKYSSCHDYVWSGEGGNNARNAIRGSCNVYFANLANRLDGRQLQGWLFDFGFGRRILPPPPAPAFGSELSAAGESEGRNRTLLQSPGQISEEIVSGTSIGFEDVPGIVNHEKKWFGIGQGNLRVTVLQAANAMAAIGRGGTYKAPRLFDGTDEPQKDLAVSEATLAVIRDGMSAVVNEQGGTAYRVFAGSGLKDRGLNIYGKTGSTENPKCAWFAGFVQDDEGRTISIAVVVVGAESGANDAAPLGKEIFRLCNENGYIGKEPENSATRKTVVVNRKQ